MYNQWALQQITAMQYLALQQQQMQLVQHHPMQHCLVALPPPALMPNINTPPPPPLALPAPLMTPHVISDDESASADEDDEKYRTLFCANLDDRITEELLYEVFLQAGPIETVRIPKDISGRKRTFGFITYTHACSAPYALSLYKGLTLFRKPITVKFQQSTSAPSTPQGRPHCSKVSGPLMDSMKRRSDGHGSSRYDNATLRSSNFSAAFFDQNAAVKQTQPEEGSNKAKHPRIECNSKTTIESSAEENAKANERSPTNANPFRRDLSPSMNPFKRDSEPSEWYKGCSLKERQAKQSRMHQNASNEPSKRRNDKELESHERNQRDHQSSGSNEQQRRHHQQSGGNRRSEQRHNNNSNNKNNHSNNKNHR